MEFKKAMRTLIPCILLMFGSGMVSSVWGSVEIIRDGISKTVIVLGTKAKANDFLAAKELAKYLNLISGATVEIEKKTNQPIAGKVTIFVGKNRYLENSGIFVSHEDEDAFILKTLGNDQIVLLGNGVRGTLYAVYSFLEKLGCRWFMPGVLGEVVSSSTTLVVKDTDVLEVPEFRVRSNSGDGDLPVLTKNDLRSFNRWMLINKFNRGFGRGYMRFNTFNGDAGHAYKDIIPQDVFTTDPMLFPLIDGQRNLRGQRCVSNPGALTKAEMHVDDVFQTYPKRTITSVSPNDNHKWCECEGCEQWDGDDTHIEGRTGWIRSYSGRVFSYANLVSDYMQEHHPGKYVVVYAYQRYSVPPTGFRPNDNLVIKITHNHSACDAHPIDSPCDVNTWFRENVVEKWSAVSSNLWFHGYTYRWKACELPYPTYFNLRDDVRYLKKKGVWGYFAMAGKLNWGTNGLSYYILSKLLWDVNADVETLIDDYCEKFYGVSASSMKSYFYFMAETLNPRGMDPTSAYEHHLINQKGLNLSFGEQFLKIYSSDVLLEADGFLQDAMDGTHDAKVHQRIEIVRYSHQYAILFMKFLEANAQRKKNKTMEDAQRTIDAGNDVLDFLNNRHVPWSVSLGTSEYGAEKIVSRVLARIKK